MLSIYWRQQPPCRFASRRFRNCKCPIGVQGSLGGEYVRRSLDLRAWEAATDLVRGWESAGKLGQQRVEIPPITTAVEKFLADAKARNLKESSLKKYRRLLEGELLPFCDAGNAVALERLTVEFLRDFRDSLAHSPITQQKKLEYLRAFLAFCDASDWLSKNPAKAVKLPKVERTQVKPFSAADIKKLLKACDEFRGDGARLRAMTLLLRNSGLRIANAVSLTQDRVKNGKLFLYTSRLARPSGARCLRIRPSGPEWPDSNPRYWADPRMGRQIAVYGVPLFWFSQAMRIAGCVTGALHDHRRAAVRSPAGSAANDRV